MESNSESSFRTRNEAQRGKQREGNTGMNDESFFVRQSSACQGPVATLGRSSAHWSVCRRSVSCSPASRVRPHKMKLGSAKGDRGWSSRGRGRLRCWNARSKSGERGNSKHTWTRKKTWDICLAVQLSSKF